MKKVYFMGITNMGCCIMNACVTVSNDYTMTELVRAIKNADYKAFKLNTMSRFCGVDGKVY